MGDRSPTKPSLVPLTEHWTAGQSCEPKQCGYNPSSAPDRHLLLLQDYFSARVCVSPSIPVQPLPDRRCYQKPVPIHNTDMGSALQSRFWWKLSWDQSRAKEGTENDKCPRAKWATFPWWLAAVSLLDILWMTLAKMSKVFVWVSHISMGIFSLVIIRSRNAFPLRVSCGI